MMRTVFRSLFLTMATAVLLGIGTTAYATSILITLHPDSGGSYSGTLDSPSYTNAPSTAFSVTALHFDVIDDLGNPLVLDNSNTNYPDFTDISTGELLVHNGAGGAPDFLAPKPGADFYSVPAPFVGIAELVNVNPGQPDKGYQLNFNNIAAQNGTFTLNALIWDGTNLSATGFYLKGTYDLAVAATPIPGALPLFASALGGVGLLAWRRKRPTAPAG